MKSVLLKAKIDLTLRVSASGFAATERASFFLRFALPAPGCRSSNTKRLPQLHFFERDIASFPALASSYLHPMSPPSVCGHCHWKHAILTHLAWACGSLPENRSKRVSAHEARTTVFTGDAFVQRKICHPARHFSYQVNDFLRLF